MLCLRGFELYSRWVPLFTQIVDASSVGPCIQCMCEWLLLHFSRNKSFPEILSSGEYKKCCFLKARDSVFVFRNSICSRLKYCSSFVLWRNTPFKPSDLSKKIEGSLLAGYKLINNNNFKDRSFQQYLILDILTNPVRVTLTEKGKILGKNPLPVSLFTYYSLRINFPFS